MSIKNIDSFALRIFVAIVSFVTLVSMSIVAAPASHAQTYTTQTIANGDLIRADGTDDVYIVKLINGKSFKRLILNPTIFDSYGHLEWGDIQDVNPSVLNNYTTSDLVREIDASGRIVGSGDVFKVSSADGADTGIKRHLQMTREEFLAAGFTDDMIYGINHLEAGPTFYETRSPITSDNVGDVEIPLDPDEEQPADDNGPLRGGEGSVNIELVAEEESGPIATPPGELSRVMSLDLTAVDSDVEIRRIDFQVQAQKDDLPHLTFDRIRLVADDRVVVNKNLDRDDFNDPKTGYTNDSFNTAYATNSLTFSTSPTYSNGEFKQGGVSKHKIRVDEEDRLRLVVREGQTVRLDVHLGIIDTSHSQLLQRWVIGLEKQSIRLVDAAGLGGLVPADNTVSAHRVIDIDNKSIEITLAATDANANLTTPDVSSESTTDIDLLSFEVENTGAADVELRSFTFDLEVSPTSSVVDNKMSNVVGSLSLHRGSREVGSVNVSTEGITDVSGKLPLSTTVLLNERTNLEVGETISFVLSGSVKALNAATTYAAGTKLKASIDTSDQSVAFYGPDGINAGTAAQIKGDSVATNNDTDGTKGHALHEVLPTVALVGQSPIIHKDSNTTDPFRLTIEARGGDIYVPQNCANVFKLEQEEDGDTGASNISVICAWKGDVENEGSSPAASVKITEGESVTIELSPKVEDAAIAGREYFTLKVSELKWDTSLTGLNWGTEATYEKLPLDIRSIQTILDELGSN